MEEKVSQVKRTWKIETAARLVVLAGSECSRRNTSIGLTVPLQWHVSREFTQSCRTNLGTVPQTMPGQIHNV